jgi:UPF0755 protein
MKTKSSFDTIVKTLQAGPPPPPTYNFLVPEGLRQTEIAKSIDEAHASSQAQSGKPQPAFTGAEWTAAVDKLRIPAKYAVPEGTKSKEGFLFPATYELLNSASADEFAEKQLDSFEQNFDSIDMSYASKRNLTPYEVVIIASMVEREARLDSERPKIAAVIYNRLKERMTLGIDATIQYAVSDKEWKNGLTESDLAIDSPYNTRLQIGLPPTPIANPGLKSLEAAAHPADVDFLYYIANPDGSGEHFFTNSYDEFLSHPFQNG